MGGVKVGGLVEVIPLTNSQRLVSTRKYREVKMSSSGSSESAAKVVDRLSLDFSRTEEVTCAYSQGSYEVLAKSERDEIKSHVKTTYSRQAADSFALLSLRWKEGSYSDSGQTFERIFDTCLDISCEERNGDLEGRNPRGQEPDVAEYWHEITKRFLRASTSNTLTAYRGIGTHDGLVEASLDILDTNQRHVSLEVTKLVNFTTDRDTANYHGLAVIEKNFDEEDVAFAADFLLPYVDNGTIGKAESELRIIGDCIQTIPQDSVSLPVSSKAIKQAVEQPAQNSSDEHDAVASIVEEIGKAGGSVSSNQAKDAIEEWYLYYKKDQPLEAPSLADDVEKIIGRPVP